MEEKNNEISLSEIFGMIIPKIWIIALVSVAFAALTGFYSLVTVKDTYTVTTQFYVEKNTYGQDQTTSDLSFAINIIPVVQEAYISEEFCSEIANILKSKYDDFSNVTAAQVRNTITVTRTNTNAAIYSVKVESTNRKFAESVANEVHNLTMPNENNESHIKTLVSEFINIEAYRSPDSNDPAVVTSGTGTVIKNSMVAFLAGAVLSIVLIVVLGIIDPTIRNKNKLSRGVDVPVLGVIPRF